ncbi:MAG: response regulator [Bacteroidales bacterium]|nr:response regulator [Bacteroidales bacterium]
MKNKILIIDDDIIYRKIIQKLLCQKYNLMFAESSAEAIDLIDTKNIPDLVIADLNLPGLGGVELISILKHKLNKSKIPIIVISGMDDDEIKDQLFQKGISGFFTKPVDRITLKEKIADLILL